MIGSDVALSGRPICVWGLESQVLVCQWGQSNQVSRARKYKGVRLREPISRTEVTRGGRALVCLMRPSAAVPLKHRPLLSPVI